MSAHAASQPFVVDPLIAEAKRRRKRRLLGVGLVLLLASGATAGALLSRSSSGPGAGGPTPSAGLIHQFRSSQGWSLRYPNGMSVEHASASGISYAVDEVTFSSFTSSPGVHHGESSGGETIRPVPPRARGGRFPTDGIAVRVLSLQTLGGGVERPVTHLPLRLSSFHTGGVFRGWYAGTQPRPLQHFLVSKWHRQYYVQVWIGPEASARQRALLGRIVSSIASRQPRSPS